MHLPTYNNNNIVTLSSLVLQYYETEFIILITVTWRKWSGYHMTNASGHFIGIAVVLWKRLTLKSLWSTPTN